jgi:hypothetical protein
MAAMVTVIAKGKCCEQANNQPNAEYGDDARVGDPHGPIVAEDHRANNVTKGRMNGTSQ